MKAKAFTVWMAMRPVARQAKQDGGFIKKLKLSQYGWPCGPSHGRLSKMGVYYNQQPPQQNRLYPNNSRTKIIRIPSTSLGRKIIIAIPTAIQNKIKPMSRLMPPPEKRIYYYLIYALSLKKYMFQLPEFCFSMIAL